MRKQGKKSVFDEKSPSGYTYRLLQQPEAKFAKNRCMKDPGNFSVLSGAEISFVIEKMSHFTEPNFRVPRDIQGFDYPVQWNECCFRAISRSKLQLPAKVRSLDVCRYLIDLHENVFVRKIRHTHEIMYFSTFSSTIFLEKNVTSWHSAFPEIAQRIAVPVAHTCTRKNC